MNRYNTTVDGPESWSPEVFKQGALSVFNQDSCQGQLQG